MRISIDEAVFILYNTIDPVCHDEDGSHDLPTAAEAAIPVASAVLSEGQLPCMPQGVQRHRIVNTPMAYAGYKMG